jgi:hypothetical protein
MLAPDRTASIREFSDLQVGRGIAGLLIFFWGQT